MLITVTQEHVDKYKRDYVKTTASKCACCPVAQALMERFQVKYVDVTRAFITIGMFPDEIYGESILTPNEVYNWINAFDREETVSIPFTFELNLTPPSKEGTNET